MKQLPIALTRLESFEDALLAFKTAPRRGAPRVEFHISRDAREEYGFDASLFSTRGNVVFAAFHQAREFAQRMNAKVNPLVHPERIVKAGKVNAMGLIDEILHHVVDLYRKKASPDAFELLSVRLEEKLGKERADALMQDFVLAFPPLSVHRGEESVEAYLAGETEGVPNRLLALEEMTMLRLANENPAFDPFKTLFDDADLTAGGAYDAACAEIKVFFEEMPFFGPEDQNLWELLRSPAVAEPYSLPGQLEYIRKKWGLFIGDFLLRLLTSMDLIKEEEKPGFFGPGPTRAYVYDEMEHEYERFSPDKDWMPSVVLIAKSTLVWMHQLSVRYGRNIDRLDLIPDEELDELASRGFTGLWLIGLWERSEASREIKRKSGNPEAAASAYSLYDYDIAGELGGWWALDNLRSRCARRGIRLGSDMVPNHTGIDSRWVMEHPDRFLQLRYPPFPTYSFNGENLSKRPGVGVYLEDHYWNRSDAAVVFKRVDFNTGDTRYIYHGNDGTSMPWNDTAQIDFLNPEAREAVIATIVGVCRQFPIVRFDAAMTLAKKHIQRLWYPEHGSGGDIASRSEHALSREEFDKRIPNEFWREVVDRCAVEAHDTLLLAEAFWMMEGYFVRTLGMHRVYNSAFMNMLKMEENAKYRSTIKNTIEFDAEILKRFVNFMNNPDEDTAVAQFGKGDKYFGVCTLMATMPGLPMFGHGQIEGFEEKYGMEYRRAYREETPDQGLVSRHEREIFPLLKRRYLFSGSENFALFDVVGHDGAIRENVFAYSNRSGEERALVLYNNAYERASGWIRRAALSATKAEDGNKRSVRRSLFEAFGLVPSGDRFLLFREQRSGLWFIRESSRLDGQGLYVELDGYESQVFLDIHEVQDDASSRWRRLCDALGGRGVPDLTAALQDLFLRDLYDAFFRIATPSFLRGARGLAEGAKAADAKAFFDSLKDPTIEFVKTAVEYLDGASGRYDAFALATVPVAKSAESVWKEFSQALSRLADWGTAEKKRLAALKKKSAPRKPDQGASEKPGETDAFGRRIDYLAGYLALSLLRGVLGADSDGEDARRLVDHWCLDRKLRELYRDVGLDGEESYRTVSLLKLLLARTGKKPAPVAAKGKAAKAKAPAKKKTPTAAEIVNAAFTAEDSRAYLGVNVYEGVAWYNKERFEEALRYGAAVAALESGQAPIVDKTAAEIEKAHDASGYQVEKLILAFSKSAVPGRSRGRSVS